MADSSFDIVSKVDHQEVDGPDVPACADRRSEREDRTADNRLSSLGHEDACLREIHELAQQIGRAEGAAGALEAHGSFAQGDDSLDIGDTGRSDQVFHADGSNLAGSAAMVLDRVRPRDTGARDPPSAANDWTFATR